MKKMTSLTLVFLLGVCCCFAVRQPANSRHLPVVGVVGKVHSASISPIVNSSDPYVGMPFDILDAGVQSTQRPEAGRQIATWSLLTNYYPATLSVTVTPLLGIVSQVPLNYMLYIKYLYSCNDSARAILTVDGALIVQTDNGFPCTASVRLSVPDGASIDSFISINNSPIRFTFTDSIESLRMAPDDEYIATVTFTVTSD